MRDGCSQHVIVKDKAAYLSDYPHLKAHIVAQMHIHGGSSIQDVAEHYGITLADVHAAIAYYYDNQDTIEKAQAEKLERARHIGKDNFHEEQA